MAYRRTANVIRRLNARHDAIVDAARAAATAGGMAAIQIAPVAARAGVAAGTVYRYFPGKIELVGALVESVADREIAAVRRGGDAVPGPAASQCRPGGRTSGTGFTGASLRQASR